MKERIKRIGALVVLGMFVIGLYSLTLTAKGIPVSTEGYWIVIDSDNNTDDEFLAVWHDGGPNLNLPGEELFRIQENGRVGIGTQTPQYRLDVNGTIQMTGFRMPTDASEGYILTSDASGVGTWQEAPGGLGGSGTINYISKFTDSTSLGDSVICEFNDNIGIGTTSPSGKLEVIGNIVVSGTVDGVDIDIAVANLIATDLILQANIDAEEAARIAADIVLQSNLDAETASRIAADVLLQANIDAEEAARIAADIALQNNIDAEEAARIAKDIALQNNIDAEEAARIAADIVLQTNIDILAAIDALDYDSLQDLEIAVANGFNIATISGNVGIGTAIPTEKLDVNGGLRVRDFHHDDTLNNIIVTDSNGVLHTRDADTIGFQTNIVTVSDDYIPKDTDYTILVDASSDNIILELPPAADAFSQVLVIKRIDDHKQNDVIIDGHGSERIDNDLSLDLDCKYISYTIQSDGSNWYILTSYGFMGRSHIYNSHR